MGKFYTSSEKEEARIVLCVLREAQNGLVAVLSDLDENIFDFDDNGKLNQALALIGDTMDGISAEYGLPIMSEQ